MSALFSDRHFKLQPIATVAMVIGFAILIGLGSWQLQRRAWKNDLLQTVSERMDKAPIPLASALGRAFEETPTSYPMRYVPVTITGRYDHANEAHLFGTLEGKPGYYIFTPFIPQHDLAKGPIYINRGFVPQKLKNAQARIAGQMTGEITVEGLFRYTEQRRGVAAWFTPVDQPEENIWYTRDPARFSAARTGQATNEPRWYIDSFGKENDGDVPEGGTTRVTFNNRHMEYALTWFGLAATLLGVWFAFSFRRKIPPAS